MWWALWTLSPVKQWKLVKIIFKIISQVSGNCPKGTHQMNTQISLVKEIYSTYDTGARVHGSRAMTYSFIQCLLFITPSTHSAAILWWRGPFWSSCPRGWGSLIEGKGISIHSSLYSVNTLLKPGS